MKDAGRLLGDVVRVKRRVLGRQYPGAGETGPIIDTSYGPNGAWYRVALPSRIQWYASKQLELVEEER